MNTFFISDLHFFHKNIIKYSNRPFSSVEEMNESLIKEWNYIVKPNDVIYNLGDFCFSDIEKLESILSRYRDWETDRKSTCLNSSHSAKSRMPSSA